MTVSEKPKDQDWQIERDAREIKFREQSLLDNWEKFSYEYLIKTYHEVKPFEQEEIAQISFEYAEAMLRQRRESLARLGL